MAGREIGVLVSPAGSTMAGERSMAGGQQPSPTVSLKAASGLKDSTQIAILHTKVTQPLVEVSP